MAMLAFSTMDVFAEKGIIIPDRVKTLQDKKDIDAGRTPKETETVETYLGLLSQNFVDKYQIDVYGYLSITNYKYLVFKTEQRFNPVNSEGISATSK